MPASRLSLLLDGLHGLEGRYESVHPAQLIGQRNEALNVLGSQADARVELLDVGVTRLCQFGDSLVDHARGCFDAFGIQNVPDLGRLICMFADFSDCIRHFGRTFIDYLSSGHGFSSRMRMRLSKEKAAKR